MSHLPKSRKCDTCLQAKLYEAPHRRRENQREGLRDARDREEAEAFLDRISVDHLFATNQTGDAGERVALVVVDRFSGLLGIFPDEVKSAEAVEDALRHFCGSKAPGIVGVASDRAPEIRKAVRELGFRLEPFVPNVEVHNPIAEAAIRTVKGCASSLLLHAGMDYTCWPLAVKYMEFGYNVTATSRTKHDPPITCFECAHGYAYEGFMIPFGALVWFKQNGGGAFEPKGAPALYLGAELIAGMKFKGNHRVWPLDLQQKGVLREVVVRTLAIPNGKWRFPLKTKQMTASLEGLHPPASLHDILDEPEDTPRASTKETATCEPPAPGAGLLPPSEPSIGAKPKPRHRAITRLRIAVHGKTKKCQGCKEGTYSHSDVCRKRFNDLLDLHEPLPKEPASPHEPKGPEALDMHDDIYLPSSADEGDDVAPSLGGAKPPLALTGAHLKTRLQSIDRGCAALASIFIDAMESRVVTEESESVLAAIYAKHVEAAGIDGAAALSANKANQGQKPDPLRETWFVEFCCKEGSEIAKVAHEHGINYLGLTKDFCDLTDPLQFAQVLDWMRDRLNADCVVHVWGSLPCTPWSQLQSLNLFRLGDAFAGNLELQTKEPLVLVDHFLQAADLAILSGGSASFEWPRFCSGWAAARNLQDFIVKHNMYSAFPTGCGFNLCIDGRRPLKPWRVVTTSSRTAVELDRRQCAHDPSHVHDPIEGGAMAEKSGYYNREMAMSILCSVLPHVFMKGIPSMPVIPAASSGAHNDLSSRAAALLRMGLVHRLLSRQEVMQNPDAIAAIKKEVSDVRGIPVWDDSSVVELHQLKQQAREAGKQVHIAEVMVICSEKNAELKGRSTFKGRLVYRGDNTRDQEGNLAKFSELHALPASLQTVALVLFYGMLMENMCQIADAKKAYLQAMLDTGVETWVILPVLCWLPEWADRFKRPAVRLIRALYGHPEAGDAWARHFARNMKSLGFEAVESFPSLYWHASTLVLVAAYVDDIIAAGPVKAMEQFWKDLQELVQLDEITVPGRYLGRDHKIEKVPGGYRMMISMLDYAKSAVDLYYSIPGVKPLKPADTPYVSESLLLVEDWEVQGQLDAAGSPAQLLMKVLWLARLCRPDLSYPVTRLASSISKWSKNDDRELYRLMCYLSSTTNYGLECFVKGPLQSMRLRMYSDADLAGDQRTMKSHSGVIIALESEEGTYFPLLWYAKRQTCVSRSTTEAEIVAVADGFFTDMVAIQTVLHAVLPVEIPAEVMEDNQSCILILKSGYSPKLRSLKRTHKISIAALSEAISSLGFALTYTETEKQKADIFTKVLARIKFLAARHQIGVRAIPG